MDEKTQILIDYIRQTILRHRAVEITPGTPLVSSGLVDSFSLIDVLSKLEEITETRIPSARVRPMDLNTVEAMFQTAERLGRRKGQ